jgi:hypothetical protein
MVWTSFICSQNQIKNISFGCKFIFLQPKLNINVKESLFIEKFTTFDRKRQSVKHEVTMDALFEKLP